MEKELADIDNISEGALNKLDHAIRYSTMPKLSYRMVHWKSGLSREEKAFLSSWINEKRGCPKVVWPIADKVEYNAAQAQMGGKAVQ